MHRCDRLLTVPALATLLLFAVPWTTSRAAPATLASTAKDGAGWPVTLPPGAVKVSDTGSEAVLHDARTAEAVADDLRKAFAGLADGSCEAGKDPAAALLVCFRTIPLEGGSSEQIKVEVSRGKDATIIRLARSLAIAGSAPKPGQPVVVAAAPQAPALEPMGELARAIPDVPPAGLKDGEELRITASGVGPIRRSTRVDAATLAQLFPGFQVQPSPFVVEGETVTAFELLHAGSLMFSVQAEDDQAGARPLVSVHSPEIPTATGIRPDDTFEALAAVHKDLTCVRSAGDGSVVLCHSRAEDNITYLFDGAGLVAKPEQEVPPAELALRRIIQIDWASPE